MRKNRSLPDIPVLVFVLFLLGSGSLAARGRDEVTKTGGAEASPETALYWRTVEENNKTYIVDGAGNRALLTTYRRIILTSPGAVEVLYMTGAESAIAALSSGRDPIWPDEKTILLPSVGNTARPSLEAIVALEPDLVIGNAMNAALMADLSSRGYTVLIHNADSLADIFNSAVLLGRLTGKEAEARNLVAEKEARLEALKAELRNNPLNLKGAFLYSASPIMAFTSRSLAGEILSILGIENIAADLNAAQPILSPEYILAENPDFLFGAMSITKPEDILAADSVIARTRAGREKNISIVPSSFFLRTSPRIVESLLELYGEIKKYARPGA
ncbi:MAG: ABC transporter substrate-binding protein [Treponema sp.]|jgi:iron complex transport system substrate-binding protein|nr:ABC transporter substrate-binding protein [Treponema sp.]